MGTIYGIQSFLTSSASRIVEHYFEHQHYLVIISLFIYSIFCNRKTIKKKIK